MSYIRFAFRCCYIFVPGCFLLLYFGAQQSFLRSLFWALAIPVLGFLLLSPIIYLFSHTDRALWSRQSERDRLLKRLEYLERLRREERGEFVESNEERIEERVDEKH